MFMIALIGTALAVSLRWDFSAKIVPLVIGTTGLLMAALSLFNDMCRKPTAVRAEGLAEQAEHDVAETIHEKIHMDLTSDTGHLPVREIVLGACRFFGYLIAFMAVMWLIGLIPTVALLVLFFMRFEGAGTLVAGHSLCGDPGARHLRRVRRVHVGAVAADLARPVVPGDEVDPVGVMRHASVCWARASRA